MTGAENSARARVRALRARLSPHEEKLRFLVVGGWNVLFSRGVLWLLAVGVVGAKQVLLFANWVIAVTHNLFSFKLLVFRTKGHWLREYARMYVTYSGMFVVESLMVQAISAWLGWSLVLSKLPTLAVVTVMSYLGHKYFTFRTVQEAVAEDLEAPGGRASS
jgi:putative flippase GtrA